MKRVYPLLVILMSLYSIHTSGQLIWPVQYIPPNPSSTDTIRTVVGTSFVIGTQPNTIPLTGYTYNISDSIIEANLFYDVTGFWTEGWSYSIDTISWGQPLAAGTYTVYHISNTYCVSSDTTIPNDTIFQCWVDTSTLTVTGPNGISTFDKADEDILLFPNPAHGAVSIYNVTGLSIKELSLFDLTGRQVRRLPSAQNPINLQGIVSGIYIVSLDTKDRSYRLKLIIN